MRKMDKVSIIVRTCGRPEVLRGALESIRKQTYLDVETVVIEDGLEISRQMICTEYSDLQLRYISTGKRVGRAKAGNLGMKVAQGKYLNFLDDDDVLYPEHIEILLQTLQSAEEKAVYSVAEEAAAIYRKRKRTFYDVRKKVRFREPFNRMYLLHTNYLPIQSVMFEKSLFEQYGGFRENVDYLEDWDLWVRYAAHTNFKMVNEITSMYRVPLNNFRRDRKLKHAYNDVQKYFSEYVDVLNFGECHREINDFIRQKYTPRWKKMLSAFLKKYWKAW